MRVVRQLRMCMHFLFSSGSIWKRVWLIKRKQPSQAQARRDGGCAPWFTLTSWVISLKEINKFAGNFETGYHNFGRFVPTNFEFNL